MRFLDELGDAIEAAAEREQQRLVRRRRTVQVAGVASIAAAGIGLVSLTGSNGSAVVDQPDLLPPPSATAPATTESTAAPDADEVTTAPNATDETADGAVDDGAPDNTDEPVEMAPATSAPTLTGTVPVTLPATTETEPPAGDTATASTAPTTAPSTVPAAAPITTAPATAPPTSATSVTCTSTVTASYAELDASQSGVVDWAPGITIAATNADGTPGSLSTRNNTVAVSGGRYGFQVDYLPPSTPGGTGTSERLTIGFASPACSIELGIRMLEVDELDDLDESLAITAIDDAGIEIERRVLVAGDAESDGRTRTFALTFAEPATSIVLEAVAYGGGVATDAGPNNSDFGLDGVTAVVARP